MRLLIVAIIPLAAALFIPELLYSDTLCVSRRARVVNGRVNMAKSVKRVGGTCPRNYVTLASTTEFVGADGPAGPRGLQGEPGPLPETLPSGKTLRGHYWLGGDSDSLFDTISFQFPLSEDPHSHYIEIGDTPPAECPGNGSNPQAAPGHLCVYERLGINAANRGLLSFAGAPMWADQTGAGIWVDAANPALDVTIAGTWAVTAP